MNATHNYHWQILKLEIDDDVAKTVELEDDVAVDSTKCKLWIDK